MDLQTSSSTTCTIVGIEKVGISKVQQNNKFVILSEDLEPVHNPSFPSNGLACGAPIKFIIPTSTRCSPTTFHTPLLPS